MGNKLFEILDNVPEEYTALSDAISRIFYVCGSGKLCGACFRGELVDYSARTVPYQHIRKSRIRNPRAFESNGCCGSCSHLSATGCVQKPLGCAGWQCPYSANLLPERISIFLGVEMHTRGGQYSTARRPRRNSLKFWVSNKLSCENGWRRDIFSFFRIKGFDTPLTQQDKHWLKVAAKRVNRIADWLERTGLNKPNWPLMEKITRAEPGTLHVPSV